MEIRTISSKIKTKSLITVTPWWSVACNRLFKWNSVSGLAFSLSVTTTQQIGKIRFQSEKGHNTIIISVKPYYYNSKKFKLMSN